MPPSHTHLKPRYPRFAPENIAKNAALVEGVKRIAEEKGCTAAQLSLAWVSRQGLDVVPIPGTTKLPHLDDNIAAMEIPLTRDELDIIASVVKAEDVQGNRYAGGGPEHNTFRAQMASGL